jgi:hypothetical protein
MEDIINAWNNFKECFYEIGNNINKAKILGNWAIMEGMRGTENVVVLTMDTYDDQG